MEHRDLFQAKPSERIVAARPATSLLMPQKRHFGVSAKPLVQFSLIIKAEAALLQHDADSVCIPGRQFGGNL
jgi:hypothetical protein